MLAAAQTAVAALPTERFLQVIGNVSAVYPRATNIPNWDAMLLGYAKNIGVPAKDVRSPDEIAEMNAQLAAQEQATAMQQQVQMGAESAKLLSETELTPGSNALAALIGG